MDYGAIIKGLRAQADQLDRAIAQLESLDSPDGQQPKRRRGRKSMAPEERKQVAERMKRYWASRSGASLRTVSSSGRPCVRGLRAR
jgi:hypothetical protein